jgi:hypothetical protein
MPSKIYFSNIFWKFQFNFKNLKLFIIIVYTDEEIQSIVTSRNEAAKIKIAQIKNNTKLQIEALKVKYAVSDTIKTKSGFIAIGALGSLALLIIVIECINLFKYIFGKEKKVNVNKPKKNKKLTKKPVYVPRQKWNRKTNFDKTIFIINYNT